MQAYGPQGILGPDLFFSDDSQESRLKLLLPALFHLAAKTPLGTVAALFFWT